MAFPVIATTNTTADTDASPTTVNMPASISAGDLLIVICAADAAGTITQSGASDWTKIEQVNNSTVVGYVLFAKIAAGSDSLTLTSTGSDDIACVSLRITGHGVSDVSTDITRGTAATGTDAAPDPPNCNPGSAKDYLWIECFAADDDDDTTNYETSTWTKVAQIQSANSTSSSLCAVASLNLNASSNNPGVMAMAATEEWVSQTLAIPPSTASQVTQTWNIRHDLASSVTESWTLIHDLASFISRTWNLRHDLSSSINRTWNLRHDLSSHTSQTWNLRHDLASSVEEIWTLRHDLLAGTQVTQTWNLRHNLSEFVSRTWNLRHDLSESVSRIWTLRHDLTSFVSQIWNFRHRLLETQYNIDFRPRYSKHRKKSRIPIITTQLIKIQIPTSFKNILNVDLPVFNQKIYEKRLSVYTVYENIVKIPISIKNEMVIKIGIFTENMLKIALKPDFRIQKLKKLSNIKKLLNILQETG
jgi:hypothetical protein